MQDTSYVDILLQFTCPPGNYNDLATLFFNTQEDAVRAIFHNSSTESLLPPTIPQTNQCLLAAEFSISTLVVFFVVYFILHCMTYGAFIPCGVFVPCLLLGCIYGSLFGALCNQFWASQVRSVCVLIELLIDFVFACLDQPPSICAIGWRRAPDWSDAYDHRTHCNHP